MDKDIILKKYGAFPSSEKGRYNWCLKCGFADHKSDSSFCVICGSRLYNFCSDEDCGHPCDTYARFCEKCGRKTELFRDGALWEYDGVKNYTYEDIKMEWRAFYDLKAKHMDSIGYINILLQPASYDDNEQIFTLSIDSATYGQEIKPIENYIPKLEWEFSKYMGKMISLKIEEIPF